MPMYNLCLLGFGNVGRHLVQILLDKREELREKYDITWRITGVATRRMGWIAHAEGLDPQRLLAGGYHSDGTLNDVRAWLASAQADVLFEMTSLNPQEGQPAIEHLRAALEHGAHALTANKGAIVHAYHALKTLAQEKQRGFFFESTVADGLPVFSLFRDVLPLTRLLRFRGLLNGTTSVILASIEQGMDWDEAIKAAQDLGIAETDPSADIDGWDAAVKVVALATVLMDIPLKLEQVARVGIRSLSVEQIRWARAQGRPYKLVSRFDRDELGLVRASVRPEQVDSASLFGSASPEALLLQFETDTIPELTLMEDHAGPYTTAYGLLSDFIYATRN